MLRAAPFRRIAMLLAACIGLVACVAPANDPSLTPQQRALREQANRWNTTVATGALTGAAAGAGIGALASPRDRGSGALVGALAGLAVGLAAGAVVAQRNLDFERQELPLRQRIADAQQRIAQLDQFTMTAEQLSRDNRRYLDELEGQYRRGQLTAAQYRGEANRMRSDLAVMRDQVQSARKLEDALSGAAAGSPDLRREAIRAGDSRLRLERTTTELENRLDRVPPA